MTRTRSESGGATWGSFDRGLVTRWPARESVLALAGALACSCEAFAQEPTAILVAPEGPSQEGAGGPGTGRNARAGARERRTEEANRGQAGGRVFRATMFSPQALPEGGQRAVFSPQALPEGGQRAVAPACGRHRALPSG